MEDFDHKLFPNNYVLNYAFECEFRKEYSIRNPADNSVVGKQSICHNVASVTGMSLQINPDTCGRCAIESGKPNPNVWGRMASTQLQSAMARASYGMFKQNHSMIGDIFDRAMAFHKTPDERTKSNLELHLFNAVKYGQFPAERALELTKKHYTPDHSVHGRMIEAARELNRRKNDPNGAVPQLVPVAPCSGCGSKTVAPPKSSLLSSIGQAMLGAGKAMMAATTGGDAPEELQKQRQETCRACDAMDSSNPPERLFRDGPMGYTCGKFRGDQIIRDETKDGCGCILALKIKIKSEKCPLGKWKE